MIIKKLSAIPYGQVKVIIDDKGNIGLISYTTQVAQIYDGWLSVNGLYSATTRKHIGAFVREYCGLDYQTAKMLYNNEMQYNIYTGEVEKVGA